MFRRCAHSPHKRSDMRESSRRISLRSSGLRLATFAMGMLVAGAFAQSPKVGGAPEAKNMRLVGYNDLQGRSAYQPIIHKQGDRYFPYSGPRGGPAAIPKPMNALTKEAEFNGTSVV